MPDAPPFDQRLFGLRVRSNRRIPFAPPDREGSPDVVATFGEMPEWLDRAPLDDRQLQRDEAPYSLRRAGDGGWVLDYADGTRIAVTRSAIWMTWRAPLGFDDACTYLVGAGFALLTRMRGAACLHASAVTMNGETIAFAGPSGSGKSTLAAALVRRGAILIAEDVLPLRFEGGRVVAVPAYAGIRLWPEAAALLMQSADALPPISPTWDKRIFEPPPGRFAGSPSRASSIVFLEDRDCELTPAEGAMRLVAHAYRPEMLDAPMRRNEFAIFSALADATPMRTLRATHDADPDMLAASCMTSSTTAG
jgi:hypothetical protein